MTMRLHLKWILWLVQSYIKLILIHICYEHNSHKEHKIVHNCSFAVKRQVHTITNMFIR